MTTIVLELAISARF